MKNMVSVSPQRWLQPLTAEFSSSLFGFRCVRENPVSVASTSRRRPQMASAAFSDMPKVIDSHLHIWASPQQAAEKYPYFPGQEPSLPGHVEFLLECMGETGVGGALIVQPINHKFDHSYVTSVLKKYPSKFFGCCLANPAEDGSGIKQLEDLISKDGYRSVRFNPYLWPPGQLMTYEVGKAMFAKAGELGAPVGFMCMKVYVKFSALFRVSRCPYPYEDLSNVLPKLVSSYGANRIMWGSDFPYVVSECGYKEAKEAVCQLVQKAQLSSSELEWIMGRTVKSNLEQSVVLDFLDIRLNALNVFTSYGYGPYGYSNNLIVHVSFYFLVTSYE